MTVHFDDAQPGQCRYALWPTAKRTGPICGEPVKPGSSYCPACHAIVYVPATRAALRTLDAVAGRVVGHVARHQPAPNVHPEFEEVK